MDVAFNVEVQVIKQAKKSKYFAIEPDDSTDLSNCIILVFFVWYENEGSIMEKFLGSFKLHRDQFRNYLGLLITCARAKYRLEYMCWVLY